MRILAKKLEYRSAEDLIDEYEISNEDLKKNQIPEIELNENESFTLTTYIDGTSPLTYQWQNDGVNISRYTNTTLLNKYVIRKSNMPHYKSSEEVEDLAV